ncbi:MAG: glutaredoxin 3 [Thiohalomonadaceae bacterium]
MAKVEIYTTDSCPFCVRARMLLDDKGADYSEYRIDLLSELRAEMQARANGGSSVPQIFIDDQHIGGCDELYALDAKGGLDPLLARLNKRDE